MSIEGMAKRLIPAAVILLLAVSGLLADPYDELRVKREEVFEFTRKPEVTRNGDTISVAFESKGFCDCTVAIENDRGQIVRHLASGVLGNNAPPPFEKNSKKQTIVWDGKDDLGRYIDDKDCHTIRVSLGLKPRFERTLFWEPKRRTQGDHGNWSVLPVAAPEGVYVYQGSSAEYVQLFDHDGNYVRTVYPFPREKLKDVKGLKWVAFPPDDEKFPVKWGMHQNTLLTAGIPDAGPDVNWPGGNGSLAGGTYSQSSALAVLKDRIALAGCQLNRLATDGGTPSTGSGQAGGLPLNGPKTAFEGPKERIFTLQELGGKELKMDVRPRSMALSPDGQWVFMTGYLAGIWQRHWLHGVARARFEDTRDAECWIGEMKKHGADSAHFSAPTSVAVDAKGRVYVSDYVNDRIQVFSEEGRYLQTITVEKPTQVFVHPKTGDLYVCSWLMYVKRGEVDGNYGYGALGAAANIPATLTHLGPLEAPQRKGSYTLPLRSYSAKYLSGPGSTLFRQGLDYRVEMDFHADPLRVWIVQFAGESKDLFMGALSGPRIGRFDENIEIYELRGDKLQLKRLFSEDVKKTGIREQPPAYARQRLYFDPKNEWFYVGEPPNLIPGSAKAITELTRVDPDTGAIGFVKLPFAAEDLGFDMEGMAYLRTADRLVRYDAREWREIPYDYGVEMHRVTHMGSGEGVKVISGIEFLGQGAASHQHGGMGVAPDGTVVVEALWDLQARHRKTEKPLSSAIAYSPRLFPGRRAGIQLRMFDKHGKCLSMDALPGIYYCEGMQLDKDRNIYVQSDYVRMYGGTRFPNGYSCTLIKAKPEKAVILTGGAPVPLDSPPKRPKDVHAGWVEGAEWLYGGVGLSGLMRFDVTPTGNCHCYANARFALDYFARSFVSESDRYRIAVLDTNGNLITRIGRYGNVDDGMPLVKAGGPPNPRSIGGDEVAIMHCLNLATHSDRRLFLADWGNYRIVSVRLGYHAEEKVALKDATGRGK